jgi:hypothetical protein
MIFNKEKYLSQLDEKQLFQLMKGYYPDLIDLNEDDQYSPIDWYSKGNDLYFESKCRSKDYPNIVVERSKWDVMRSKTNCYYVSSFPKGIYMVDIPKTPEPIWGENWMRKSTFYSGEERISKTSGFIKFDDNYTYQVDHLLFEQF